MPVHMPIRSELGQVCASDETLTSTVPRSCVLYITGLNPQVDGRVHALCTIVVGAYRCGRITMCTITVRRGKPRNYWRTPHVVRKHPTNLTRGWNPQLKLLACLLRTCVVVSLPFFFLMSAPVPSRLVGVEYADVEKVRARYWL